MWVSALHTESGKKGKPWVTGQGGLDGSQSWNLEFSASVASERLSVVDTRSLPPTQPPSTFTHYFQPVDFRRGETASPVIPTSLSGRLPEYSTPGLLYLHVSLPRSPQLVIGGVNVSGALVAELTLAKISTPEAITILSVTTGLQLADCPLL